MTFRRSSKPLRKSHRRSRLEKAARGLSSFLQAGGDFADHQVRRRLSIEGLEDRRVLATFVDGAPTLSLALAANESVGIVAGASTYTLTLTGGTWSGADDGNVSGDTTSTLTVQKAAFTQITLDNQTGAGGTAVAFNDSGANAYAANFTIDLHDSPAATALAFNGVSSFGAFSMNANVDTSIVVNAGANLATTNGAISLTAAGFNDAAGASVNSSGANITVAADQMNIQGVIDAGSHIVALQPKTNNTTIDLGGADAPGTLGLTNAELAQVTAGILRIGTTGGVNTNITLSSSITDAGAGWNTLSLLTNSGVSATISQNSGASLTVSNLYVFAAGVVNLTDPGNAVSQISGVASGYISFVDSTSLTVADVEPSIGFHGLGSLYSGAVSLTLLGTGDLLTVSNAIDMTQAGNSGDVILSADDMAINAAIKAPGKAVTLRQGSTTSRDVDLGIGATAGDLGISGAELDQITASSVTIGRSDNPGSIVITAPVTTHAGYSDLNLKSGGDINVDYDLTTSGALSLNAAGTTSIAAAVSASTTPTVTGGSLLVDYTGGASLPQGMNFSTSTSGATLTVSDAGGSGANNYSLNATSIARDGASPITYSGTLASLVIDGSDGDNTLSVDNGGGLISAAITFAGGLGFDSLNVTGDAGAGVTAGYNDTGSD
ncbi:MAG TPA: hypothetical protein VHC19_22385, partial [Pirellulales bacterium]|nr:hypothetical protein [Pirellulales bacterium]